MSFKTRAKITVKEESPLEALGLEHFLLPFACLGGGVILATFVFILELYTFNRKKKTEAIIVHTIQIVN